MNPSPQNSLRLSRHLSAALSVCLVIGIGWAIGFLTRPGEWYESLNKPAFNPPGWVFGPVWTILYGLIGIAGWRIWRLAPKSSAMMLWGAQMVLNWLWSPAFFGAQAPELAFAIIIALLVATIGFILQAWKHDGVAACLFIPYAGWVAFATALNGFIVVMN